jgi:hypothetical protein
VIEVGVDPEGLTLVGRFMVRAITLQAKSRGKTV